MSDQTPGLYTLGEAAELTGLSVDAFRKRIQRGRLRAVKGNDGMVRVRLDLGQIEALKAGQASSHPAELDRLTSALEAEAAALREALARERARADQSDTRERAATAEVADARERAARAEGEAEAARERAARIEAELDAYAALPWWRRVLLRPR